MNVAAGMLPQVNKRQRTLITPEGLAVPVTIASRGSRLGALILDFVLIFVALFIIQLALMFIFGGIFDAAIDAANESVSGAGEFLLILLILIIFLARYGYFLSMELGPRGATYGKRAVGIRVAARNGGRLTPEAVIARNLGEVIGTAGFITAVALFVWYFILLLLAWHG